MRSSSSLGILLTKMMIVTTTTSLLSGSHLGIFVAIATPLTLVGLILGTEQVVQDVDDGRDVPLGLTITILEGRVESTWKRVMTLSEKCRPFHNFLSGHLFFVGDHSL